MFTTPILVGTGPVGAGVAGAAGVAAPCPKAAVPNAMLRPIATILNFAMLMDYVLLGFVRVTLVTRPKRYGFFGVVVPAGGWVAAAPLGRAGVFAGLGDGAATPDATLYASINGLVMFVPGFAYSTGVCGLETSITTAYPLSRAYFSSTSSIFLPRRFRISCSAACTSPWKSS